MVYPLESGERDCGDHPFFSIGVTTYDRVSLLVETLSTILEQTFDDFEVIIGNDNPGRVLSEESLGIFDRRIRFVNHRENLGELDNMNSLIQISRGRYFTWIADDDLYTPDFLKTVHSSLVQHNFPVCVYTSFARMNNKQRTPVRSDYIAEGQPLTGIEFLDLYSKGRIKTIGTMGVFERDYLKNLGGLEDISGVRTTLFCEYMLILRTAMLQKIVYINAPLVIYRTHEQSWGNSNADVEAYKRAGDILVKKSIEVLSLPQFRSIFFSSYYLILKLSMVSYITVLSMSGNMSLIRTIEYMVYAKKYVRMLKSCSLYWISVASLFKAELRLLLSALRHKSDRFLPGSLKSALLNRQIFSKVQTTILSKRKPDCH